MYNPPISQNNWIESYPFLEAASWIDIYKLPFAVCRDTYIQSLQYKILHRYFNCNSNLFKWKIRKDPYCNECGNIDTIEHFFYYCRVVNIFWNRIENWLKNIMEIYVKFTLLEIILGITFKNSFAHLCNYIVLRAKHFIYIKKKYDEELFFIEFLLKLKGNITVEKNIMYKKGMQQKFDDIFGIVYNAL